MVLTLLSPLLPQGHRNDLETLVTSCYQGDGNKVIRIIVILYFRSHWWEGEFKPGQLKLKWQGGICDVEEKAAHSG